MTVRLIHQDLQVKHKAMDSNLRKINEPLITVPNPRALQLQNNNIQVTTPPVQNGSAINISKYCQLLNVIEEVGKDIRPSYAGSRSSAERVKRAIMHARTLVKECIAETEKTARLNP